MDSWSLLRLQVGNALILIGHLHISYLVGVHSSDHSIYPTHYSPCVTANMHNMNLESDAPTSAMSIHSQEPCKHHKHRRPTLTKMEDWTQTIHNAMQHTKQATILTQLDLLRQGTEY